MLVFAFFTVLTELVAAASSSIDQSPTSISAWTLPWATPIGSSLAPEFPLSPNYSSKEQRYLSPLQLAVAPLPFHSRNESNVQYAPTAKDPFGSYDNSTAHFQIFDKKAASELLGESPEISLLIKGNNPQYQFAFEAPTYFPKRDSIHWAANPGQFGSNLTVNSRLYKISNLTKAIDAQKNLRGSNDDTDLYGKFVENADPHSPAVQMMNGGTNYNGNWLTANTGRGADMPSSLALIDSGNATRVKTLLNNVRGVDFNSLDDLAIHPKSGAIFVTDPYYGPLKKYKPKPAIAPLTWVFSPLTGQLYPIEDTLKHPNGLAFSPDGNKVYITDSAPDFSGVYQDDYELLPSSVYVYDVHTISNGPTSNTYDVTHHLSNKRLFIRPHSGIVDGIKVDAKGNVYGSSIDGVTVWSPTGKPIMTIFLPFGGTVNFVFADRGRLIVLQKSQIWFVQLSTDVKDPGLDRRPGAGLSVEF
ncbi:unnamed protein product [Sympodiomycopsis kandeliae]